MFFVDDQQGCVVGLEGEVFYTNDGGETWNAASEVPLSDFYAIHFSDASNGWAVGNEGTVLETSDGGKSWDQNAFGHQTTLRDVFFIDENRGWISSNEGTIYHTVDGGLNWEEFDSGSSSEEFESIHFYDESNGIAVGQDRFRDEVLIYYTSDGGESWTLSRDIPFFQGELNDIHMVGPDEAWVVGGEGDHNKDGKILHTTNGGESWDLADGYYPQTLYAIHFTIPDYGVAAGTTIYSYELDPPLPAALQSPIPGEEGVSNPTFVWNEGKWAQSYHFQLDESSDFTGDILYENEQVTETTYDLTEDVLEPNQQYFWRVRSVNYNGKSEWTQPINFYTDETVNIDFKEKSDKEKIALYPNPASDEVQLHLEQSALDIHRAELRDLKGRKIKFVTITKDGATLDLSEIDKGLYVVNAFGGGFSRSLKLRVK